ncbi:molybdopterin-dependent oxidoreductase [Raoultibacter timonensis]|uniref:Dehydrogenase n=1 Tax=Raoultibacter timonensis TaxID=1907662 RepID=A0ABM7WKE2_9ACTN|nr:molybdopterin-dependent oxidoreductase [Raoultibacter timonensis]BDE96846.1 dehydrogenase [Raoultibacter timonensis]BDF51449.1 dehydrogenase [Raoultibacter timonensis]
MTKKYLEGNQYNPDIYRSDLDHWQEGDYTVYRTTQWTAPGCHDGCGILAYVNKEGKLEKIEGDPANGYSRGALCMRCLDIVEAMYAEDRLKYPMKRAYEDRGKDKWERISWDEAFDLIEEKVRYFQETYGSGSIVVQQGTGRNTTFFHSTALCYVGFNSPSDTGGFLSGSSCYGPRASVMALMAGCFIISDMSQALPERFDSPDYVLPECILIWGNSPLVSNPDGFLGHWIVEAMKRGSELVVVDPRLTWLAAKAKYWLPLRPATDAALAMAIANVIDEEDLIDHEFIDCWSYGYETFIEGCRTMSVEQAAEICCLDAEDIRAAARFIGSAKPCSLQWGLKLDQQVSATPAGQAIMGIVGMTGNIDVPGGNLLMVDHAFNLALSTGSNWRFVPEDQRKMILGNNRYPMHAQGDVGNMAQEDVVLETLESDGKLNDVGKDFPLKMFVLYSTNPISNMATEAPRIYDAMVNHSEFNVDINYVLTPSAMAYCELVLPIAMGPERNSLRAWWWPLRVIRKASDRYYECKTDEELVAELCNRLNPDSPIPSNDIDWMNQILSESNTDLTFDELTKKVIVWPDWHYKKYETGEVRYDGQPGFNTYTGRFEFTPVLFQQFNLPLAPYYEEPRESPVSTPDLAEEYPLILMTGRRSWEFFHSEHRNLETMREFHPDPIVEISPELAEEQEVQDGDWVWIENHRGRCRQRAKITPGLNPRYVMSEHGWWFPEGDRERLFGVFDSNINNLTTQSNIGQSGYGAPYNGLLCKIYKCTESNSEVLPTEQVTEKGGWSYERNHLEF